jgi:hypothetical protein
MVAKFFSNAMPSQVVRRSIFSTGHKRWTYQDRQGSRFSKRLLQV